MRATSERPTPERERDQSEHQQNSREPGECDQNAERACKPRAEIVHLLDESSIRTVHDLGLPLPSVFPIGLRSVRVGLREFEPTDLQDVQRYAGDPEAIEHVVFGPNQLEETETYLQRAIASARVVPRRPYEVAIITNENRNLIGSIRLGINSERNRDASLGYFLRRDLWGRGLTTEAATLLLTFGFEHLHLHRIWATCSTENTASARVLEKLGMRREGHFREDVQLRGRWRSSYLYAVLATEWPGRSPAS